VDEWNDAVLVAERETTSDVGVGCEEVGGLTETDNFIAWSRREPEMLELDDAALAFDRRELQGLRCLISRVWRRLRHRKLEAVLAELLELPAKLAAQIHVAPAAAHVPVAMSPVRVRWHGCSALDAWLATDGSSLGVLQQFVAPLPESVAVLHRAKFARPHD
jgi:hypothetical protein